MRLVDEGLRIVDECQAWCVWADIPQLLHLRYIPGI
jgi:hypothetical protein